MATYAFLLSALAAVAAALLWYLDSRGRTSQEEPATGAAEVDVPTSVPAVDEVPVAAPEPVDDDAAPLDVEIEEEPEVEAVTGEPMAADEEPAADEPGAEPDGKEGEPSPTVGRRRPGLALPRSLRRERRSWAEAHGFDFTREDEYLHDEWSRGAAASGAVARDIVRGRAEGHELLLMDLGGVNVMAMGTGAASDLMVDFRRSSFGDDGSSGDLIEVLTVGDFRVFATEQGPAERLIDARVRSALEQLPEIVTAVWMESDWVLAETGRGSRAEDWDTMLVPLARLADAARMLPPRESAARPTGVGHLDPTRSMCLPTGVSTAGASIAEEGRPPAGEVASLPARPLVVRPEEPLEMPSRVRAEARGVVEPREIGADEVAAIADGTPPERSGPGGIARMPRDLSGGPSIFGDRTD